MTTLNYRVKLLPGTVLKNMEILSDYDPITASYSLFNLRKPPLAPHTWGNQGVLFVTFFCIIAL